MLVEEAAELADVVIDQFVELLIRVEVRDRGGAVVVPEVAGVVPAPAGEVLPGNQSSFQIVCCWESHAGFFPLGQQFGDHAQVQKTLLGEAGGVG